MLKFDKVYHVNQRDGNWWKGEEEGNEEPIMEAMNRDIIIRRMEEKAKLNRPSKLVIHDKEGGVELEETFIDTPSSMADMKSMLISE